MQFEEVLTGKLSDNLSFKKPFTIKLEVNKGEWECYETETFKGGQIVGRAYTKDKAIKRFKELLALRYEEWLKQEADGTINDIDKTYILDYLKEYIE